MKAVALATGYGGSGYVAAKVGGSSLLLLVDSGAALSVIPKQVWMTITKGGSELEKYQGDVSAANGGVVAILGRWHTVCQFETLALITEFLVADVPSEEILLGFDFLLKYGVAVDFGKRECKLMGKSFPLLTSEDLGQPQNVTVPNDTAVPPRSEVIITGKVEHPVGSDCDVLLEPVESVSNKCNIMVARVVCRVEQGFLPVRVINVTDTSVEERNESWYAAYGY